MTSTAHFIAAYPEWTWKEWKSAAVACFIPISLMVLWTLRNTGLPFSDATDFLYHGVYNYKAFAEGRWMDGFTGLYTHRGWRPVIFHIPHTFFLLLSGGSMLFSSSAIMVSCVTLSAMYLYAFSRLMLPRGSAILATALIGSLPMVQWQGGTFAFAESGFFPAALAAMYHMIRSDYFRVRRHSIYTAAALTLALTLRPVEGILHLALPVCIYLTLGYRQRIFTGVQIAQVFSALVLALILLTMAGWMPQWSLPTQSPIFADRPRGKFFVRVTRVVSVLAIGAIVYWCICFWRTWSKPSKGHYVVGALSAAICLTMLWFIGVVPGFVDWFYTCNFGSLSVVLPEFTYQSNAFSRWHSYVVFTGPLVFYGLLSLAPVSYFYCMNTEQRAQWKQLPPLLLCSAVPLILIITSVTVQSTPRKLSLAFPLIALMLASLVLSSGKWQRARHILLIALLACQAGVMYWVHTGMPRTEWMKKTVAAETVVLSPVTDHPNTYEIMRDFLVDSAKKHGYTHYFLATPIMHMHLADPFMLGMMLYADPLSLRGEYTQLGNYDATSANRFLGKQTYQAFFIVNPLEGPIPQTPQAAAYYKNQRDILLNNEDKLFMELLRLYAAGKLGDMGAHKRECVTLAPTRYEGCIFEIKPPTKR